MCVRPSRPICSVSVDLDPIRSYYEIHGLGDAWRAMRLVVMERCVPRFVDLFERCGIPATFFVVGQDLDPRSDSDAARMARGLLRSLTARGHELANHSYRHDYRLTRRSPQRIGEDLRRAHDLISEMVGEAVVGFRAPGYNLSGEIVRELIAMGYRYDASICPAPIYYVTKAAVMAAMRLLGYTSGAVLGNCRALASPRFPYRPDPASPWRRGDAPLIEMPIAVTPWLRVPVIGTSLFVAPPRLRRRWLRRAKLDPFLNLELHGIDLADAREDDIPHELVRRQPDLAYPLSEKRAVLAEVLTMLAAGSEILRLDDAASRFEQVGAGERNHSYSVAQAGSPATEYYRSPCPARPAASAMTLTCGLLGKNER